MGGAVTKPADDYRTFSQTVELPWDTAGVPTADGKQRAQLNIPTFANFVDTFTEIFRSGGQELLLSGVGRTRIRRLLLRLAQISGKTHAKGCRHMIQGKDSGGRDFDTVLTDIDRDLELIEGQNKHKLTHWTQFDAMVGKGSGKVVEVAEHPAKPPSQKARWGMPEKRRIGAHLREVRWRMRLEMYSSGVFDVDYSPAESGWPW